jgi:hypothetical protein
LALAEEFAVKSVAPYVLMHKSYVDLLSHPDSIN